MRATSVGTEDVLALPALSMLWFPPILRRLRRLVLTAALFIWLVTWIFAIVASETLLRDYPYRYRLGFGHIMTLVMLFSQVWDIVYYPLGKPDDGLGQMRRITYWWRTAIKPWYSKRNPSPARVDLRGRLQRRPYYTGFGRCLCDGGKTT